MTPSTKNPKLEDILEGHQLWCISPYAKASLDTGKFVNKEQATQQIQAALDWIIGEDEPVIGAGINAPEFAHRNNLRAEQRKRRDLFCGKEQG